jgi:hypothetical protein
MEDTCILYSVINFFWQIKVTKIDILLKNMLEKVWWFKCFEMEFWNQTICCPMSYSNKGTHTQVRDGRRSHAILRWCWKGKMLLSTCAKVSKGKGCWSTINLTTMIKSTKVQAIGVTMVVGMNPTPTKIIRKEGCFWAKGPFGLSKDLEPKRHQNIWRREKSKEIKDSMKVEEGNVHCKK